MLESVSEQRQDWKDRRGAGGQRQGGDSVAWASLRDLQAQAPQAWQGESPGRAPSRGGLSAPGPQPPPPARELCGEAGLGYVPRRQHSTPISVRLAMMETQGLKATLTAGHQHRSLCQKVL